MNTSSTKKGKRLNFPVMIFFLLLLFTIILWDHYLNSEITVSRFFVSNLVLLTGLILSCSVSYFVWSLEAGKAYLEKEIARRIEELKVKEGELSQAVSEKDLLQEVIPICAYCKNVRTDKGAWQKMELYIQAHADAKFSHGICQDCLDKQMWKK